MQREKIVSMLKRIIIALTIACFALAETKATPKYIFLFIGDSMGLGHIMATEEYLRTNEFEPVSYTHLEMRVRIPVKRKGQGMNI